MMKVTVAVPFYNASATLELAILSIINQTHDHFECFLVDDGSSDGSLDIARKYVLLDPRFKLISDGRNLGLVFRLNQITSLSNCEWIVRMDADDVMFPTRLEQQIAYSSNCDIVASDVIIMDSKCQPVSYKDCSRASEKRVFDYLKLGGLVHPSLMISRQWAQDNPYDARYLRAEDRELWCRTLKTVRINVVPEALLFYRFIGQVRKDAYLMSYRSERKVLLAHGPDLVGWFYTCLLYCRSLLKSVVFRIICFVGLEQRLFSPVSTCSSDDFIFWRAEFERAVKR